MKSLTTTDVELDRPNETLLQVKAEGYVHYITERDYGSDADGNRGSVSTEVDEVTNIEAYDENGDAVELTKYDIARIETALVAKFLEQGA